MQKSILLTLIISLTIIQAAYSHDPCPKNTFSLDVFSIGSFEDCLDRYEKFCCLQFYASAISTGHANTSILSETTAESTDTLLGVRIVNGIIAFISLVACVLVLRNFFKHRFGVDNSTTALAVISMFFSDIGLSIAKFLIYFDSSKFMYTIQGFIGTSCLISSYIWGLIFIYLAYSKLKVRQLPKYSKLLTINLSISLIPSLVTTFSEVFNGSIAFHYIDGFTIIRPIVFDVIIFEVPLILTGIATFIGFYKIYREISYLLNQRYEVYLLMFPMMLTISTLPSILVKVYMVVTGEYNFWLLILSFWTNSSLGLLNAIVYKNKLNDEKSKKQSCLIERDSEVSMDLDLVKIQQNDSFEYNQL